MGSEPDAPAQNLFSLSASAPRPREYQRAIIQSALAKGSTLVVLPTGLGKTLIAAGVASEKLKEGRVLFLAPTRPLVSQHEKTMREMLTLKPEEIALVSGLIPAKKRTEIYKPPAKLVLSTPQTIANDLAGERLKWDFGLVIFDEVHRTVGKYAYAKVAEAARAHNAMCLGLTASPGGHNKKIQDVLASLGIQNVEIRTVQDADVAPYVQALQIQWMEVELPKESMELKKTLEEIIAERAGTLQKMGYAGNYRSKKGLAELRARILQSSSPLRYSALSFHATLFSMVHVLELFETQGVEAVSRFIEKVKAREPSKAQARMLNDRRFVAFVEKLKGCDEHPKLAKLIEVLKARKEGEKSIVFCQYRDQVEVLVRTITNNGMLARAFMGKKDRVTAKGQAATIQEFRDGKFGILVATSIGEEGLDIPSVDSVIFYEPVPSEIRTIQRRGRAGRAKVGRMVGFITKGTRDQASFWSSKRKEEKMVRIVGAMAGRTPVGWKTTNSWRKYDREPAPQEKREEAKTNRPLQTKPAKEEEPKNSPSKEKNMEKKEKPEADSSASKKGQSKISDF